MAVQENELHEAVLELLIFMEAELQRENLSLQFNDAWLDVEHFACEIGVKNGS